MSIGWAQLGDEAAWGPLPCDPFLPAELTKKDLRSAHAYWLPKEGEEVPRRYYMWQETKRRGAPFRSAHAYWLPKEGEEGNRRYYM